MKNITVKLLAEYTVIISAKEAEVMQGYGTGKGVHEIAQELAVARVKGGLVIPDTVSINLEQQKG